MKHGVEFKAHWHTGLSDNIKIINLNVLVTNKSLIAFVISASTGDIALVDSQATNT